MTAKERYRQKLKDPRLLECRRRIRQRDDFTCRICGDSERTQHVHHKYYLPGREPWEYSDGALLTVCDKCHKREGDELKRDRGWELVDSVMSEMRIYGLTIVQAIAEAKGRGESDGRIADAIWSALTPKGAQR